MPVDRLAPGTTSDERRSAIVLRQQVELPPILEPYDRLFDASQRWRRDALDVMAGGRCAGISTVVLTAGRARPGAGGRMHSFGTRRGLLVTARGFARLSG